MSYRKDLIVSEIMIAFKIWIQNMKGLEKPFKIHEFSRKSDKYWGSCACFSELLKKSEKSEKKSEKKREKSEKSEKKARKARKKARKARKRREKRENYYFLIFVWNFQKSYCHAKIINSRQKIFSRQKNISRQKIFPAKNQKLSILRYFKI